MSLSIVLFLVCTFEVSVINNSTCYQKATVPFETYSICNANITDFNEQHRACYWYFFNQYLIPPSSTDSNTVTPIQTVTKTLTPTLTTTNTLTPTNTRTPRRKGKHEPIKYPWKKPK